MIAVDTNLLVYAHRTDAAFHEPARAALEGLSVGRSARAVPWPCVHEFISPVLLGVWDLLLQVRYCCCMRARCSFCGCRCCLLCAAHQLLHAAGCGVSCMHMFALAGPVLANQAPS